MRKIWLVVLAIVLATGILFSIGGVSSATLDRPFNYTITATGTEDITTYPDQTFTWTVKSYYHVPGGEHVFGRVSASALKWTQLFLFADGSAHVSRPWRARINWWHPGYFPHPDEVDRGWGCYGWNCYVASSSVPCVCDFKWVCYGGDHIEGCDLRWADHAGGNRGVNVGWGREDMQHEWADVEIVILWKKKSETHTEYYHGSGSVKKTDGAKLVGSFSPRSGSTNTVTCNNPNVIVWLEGNSVYARTDYSETETRAWLSTETGAASVNVDEGDKYITTSTLEAPNNDTAWSVTDDSVHVDSWMVGPELYARATPTYYTLTMQVNGSGSADPPMGTHDYPEGEMVTITATPDSGWQFDNWTGNVTDPDSATTTVTMDSDKTVTANFIEGEAKGGCFIATAAYGSYLDRHVQTLRDFRDQYLLTNPVGSAIVSTYYKLSPPLAGFIDDHPALKPIVRVGLLPAVALSTVAVNTTFTEKMAIVSLALLSIALAMWLRKRRSKGSRYC